jgi:hypothetical protein
VINIVNQNVNQRVSLRKGPGPMLVATFRQQDDQPGGGSRQPGQVLNLSAEVHLRGCSKRQ